MTHADRLLRAPATFRRLTGLSPAAFHRLLGEVTAADATARTRRAARPSRQRKGLVAIKTVGHLRFRRKAAEDSRFRHDEAPLTDSSNRRETGLQ